MSSNRRFRPGPTVTFWLVILGLGCLLLGAGIGEAVVAVVRHVLPSGVTGAITLRALGKPAQAAIIFVIGGGLVVLGWWQLRQSHFIEALSLVENQSPGQVLVTRQPGSGLPNVLLFSGHMGLLILLNALQDLHGRITAVAPPGSDFRSIARLLRPSHPEARITSATVENAELSALLSNGATIVGAANLEHTLDGSIDHVFLSSGGSTTAPTAAWPLARNLEDAIDSADLIVFGPGSFFTSVAPSLLVPALRDRLAHTTATTVYVCNIMTEPGRTDGWTVTDFIRHFIDYSGFPPRFTIVNRSYPGANILNRYEITGSYPVMVSPEEHFDATKVVLGNRMAGSTTVTIEGSTVVEADIIEVINENRLTFDPRDGTASEQTVSVIRHDSQKLARVLRNIIALTRVSAAVG